MQLITIQCRIVCTGGFYNNSSTIYKKSCSHYPSGDMGWLLERPPIDRKARRGDAVSPLENTSPGFTRHLAPVLQLHCSTTRRHSSPVEYLVQGCRLILTQHLNVVGHLPPSHPHYCTSYWCIVTYITFMTPDFAWTQRLQPESRN